MPPTLNPNDLPYFGNRLDVNIQLRPRPLTLQCLLDDILVLKNQEIKYPPQLSQIDLKAELPVLKPKPVPWQQLASTYREAKVPNHRMVYEALLPMIKPELPHPPISYEIDPSIFKELNIDIAALIDALSSKEANTTFEELTCVGLNTDTDILGGVIQVKKPYGYSGSLCQSGSHEYVAFWADWNNDGNFDEYLGTASVETHDLAKLPGGGLCYAVMLPCNFSERLKTCENPVVVRIRGVLSWAVPPSTTDPNSLNYWGNSLDVVVQLRPVGVPPGQGLFDLIYDVGGVSLPNISGSTHLAFPAPVPLNTNQCGMGPWDRPFGGGVRIGGRIYNTGPAGSVYYQVQYAPSGSGSWLPVTNQVTFELMHPLPWDPKYPQENVSINSPDGWFPYMEDPTASPPIFERTARLANWQTGSLSGDYDLRLVYCLGDPHAVGAVYHYSAIVTIKVDNHGFTVSPTANVTLDKTYDLDLIITGGDCHSYEHGVDTITGKLHAVSDNFWKWVFELQPTTHTHGTNANPACRSYISLADTGDDEVNWTLNTGSLDPCGYTLTLRAYDRTIVDSNGALVHSNGKAVGFSVT